MTEGKANFLKNLFSLKVKKISIIITVLILIIGAIFFLFQRSASKTSFSKNLLKLLDSRKDLECSSFKDGQLKIFVKKNSFKFEIPLEKEKIYIVYQNGNVYQWNENQNKGVILKKENLSKEDLIKIIKIFDKEEEMKCQQKELEDEIFEVPKNVNFEEISEILKQFLEKR